MIAADALLDEFVTALRVGMERRVDFLTAVRDNPPHDIQRLYWLARVTLVTRLEDIPFFDAVFASFFLGALPQPAPQEAGEEESPEPQGQNEPAPMTLAEGTGKTASVHHLRHRRDYAGGDERARRGAPRARRAPPEDPLAPAQAAPTRLDRRAPHAAPRHAHGRDHDARAPRPPAPDAPAAAAHRRLRLPSRAQAGLPALRVGGAVQTFTFGTQLTRVTRQLRSRELSTALADVSAVVEDADGGTRIGPALHEFVTTPRYADRARGALTIVLSDGLERGDPALMVAAVGALSRLSHKLLWWSPLALHPEYRPVTRGMAAILDDIELAGARDLQTLLERVREL